QPDGKVFAGGSGDPGSSLPRNNIFRLNPDGSLDATFPLNTEVSSDSTILYSDVRAMLVESNDRLLLAGNFDVVKDTEAFAVARIVTALPPPSPTPTPTPTSTPTATPTPAPTPTATPTATPTPSPVPTPAGNVVQFAYANYNIIEECTAI